MLASNQFMKHYLNFAVFFICISVFSQDEKTNGLFYKISLASTLAVNEDYTLAEDDSGPLINPSDFL